LYAVKKSNSRFKSRSGKSMMIGEDI